MPVRVYFGFLGRLTLESREYAVMKTSIIESPPPGDYKVEILCEPNDAELLLAWATQSYPDAIPYIQTALDSVPRLS